MLRASSGVIRSSALDFAFSVTTLLLLRFLFGTLRRPGGEGAVARYGLSHNKGVDVVGAFVGVDAFDVRHVLHHAIVEEDAVAPEDIAGECRGTARLGNVVHLEQRDRRGVELAGVLETTDVDGEEL